MNGQNEGVKIQVDSENTGLRKVLETQKAKKVVVNMTRSVIVPYPTILY